MQPLPAEFDQIGRYFAGLHRLGVNDFRALPHIIVAIVAGEAGFPLTAGELIKSMELSGVAITYLVKRMFAPDISCVNPIRRTNAKSSCSDEQGMAVARAFSAPMGTHTYHAMVGLSDADLAAVH